MVDKCPNTRDVTVFGRNKEKRIAMLFHPRCKSWNCDFCAEMNKDYWVYNAARGAILLTMEGHDLQFITLTSRGAITRNQSIHFFKTNWPKLRKRASDRTKAQWADKNLSWAYFLVPEQHKSGVLHAHLIAATPLATARWWKDNAWSTGFGYQAALTPVITPEKAAGYVAKYLHKGAGAEVWPSNFRRVRHSQNWPLADPQALPGWTWETIVKENDVWIEMMALINMGWTVFDKRDES